jgi:hypothetical protein
MSLNYNLRDVPFTNRAERITNPEYVTSIRGGNAPRDWYELDDDNKEGVEPGVWMMTSATHALIWLTMSVGLGQITAKNWKTFYTRVNYIESLRGARRSRRNEDGTVSPLFITPQDVRDHIGLGTNVSRMTDLQFLKHVFENHSRDTERACARVED